MTPHRPYPPDWLSDEDAAYLLSIGASTFRDYVRRRLLPQGVLVGSSRRWSRAILNDAMEALGKSPEVDPITQAMKDYAAKERAANGGKLSKGPSSRRMLPKP